MTARVVCRQLGYPDALSYSSFVFSGLQFGVETLNPFVTEVVCFGNESKIKVSRFAKTLKSFGSDLYSSVLSRNANTIEASVPTVVLWQFRVVSIRTCFILSYMAYLLPCHAVRRATPLYPINKGRGQHPGSRTAASIAGHLTPCSTGSPQANNSDMIIFFHVSSARQAMSTFGSSSSQRAWHIFWNAGHDPNIRTPYVMGVLASTASQQ